MEASTESSWRLLDELRYQIHIAKWAAVLGSVIAFELADPKTTVYELAILSRSPFFFLFVLIVWLSLNMGLVLWAIFTEARDWWKNKRGVRVEATAMPQRPKGV